MKRTALVAAAALLFCVSCSDQRSIPTEPTPAIPDFEIRDEAHNGGTEGFFFLPPVVAMPAFDGTFDADLSPIVTICAWENDACATEIAVFGMDDGPGGETVGVSTADEHYKVNWHTDDFGLSADVTYRILVSESGIALGHADVDVVSSGKELKNVDTDEFIALKDGRTLPVKFRIEESDTPLIDENGGTVTSPDGLARLVIPPGAVSVPTEITIAARNDVDMGAGRVWKFQPEGLIFDAPAQLTLPYDPGVVPDGTDPTEALVIGRSDGGDWSEVVSTADPTTATLTGEIGGFSLYAPMFRIRLIRLTPDALTLAPGEQATLASSAEDVFSRELDGRLRIWGSRDTEVATVDQSGLVTAIAEGTTEVGVAAGIYGCASLPFVLCVYIPPNTVGIAYAEVTVAIPVLTANAGEDQTVVDTDRNGSEDVTLDGSASTDSNGTIVSYSWFEGPTTGTPIASGVTQAISLAVGVHTITLVIEDNDGETASDDVVVTVEAGNQPPNADAGPDQTLTDLDGSGNETVFLDGSGSSDSDGTIVSYNWFEGPTTGTPIATGVAPAVTLAAGVHTLTLIVEDEDGDTASDDLSILVEEAPPTEMTWSVESSPTTERLLEVWGSSPTDVYAAGDGAALLRFDGTGWTMQAQGTLPADMEFRGLSGIPGQSSDVLAGGASATLGNMTFEFNGTTWEPRYDIPSGYTSIVPGAVRAISEGAWGLIVGNVESLRGRIWRATSVNSIGVEWGGGDGTALMGAWGTSFDGTGFAVGLEWRILHNDGSGWFEQHSSTAPGSFQSVWGSAVDDVFVVGEGGTIWHYDGFSWTGQASGTTNSLIEVFGSASDDVYAVGVGSTVLHYDGLAWSPVDVGVSSDFYGLWVSADGRAVFIVGSGGLIVAGRK